MLNSSSPPPLFRLMGSWNLPKARWLHPQQTWHQIFQTQEKITESRVTANSPQTRSRWLSTACIRVEAVGLAVTWGRSVSTGLRRKTHQPCYVSVQQLRLENRVLWRWGGLNAREWHINVLWGIILFVDKLFLTWSFFKTKWRQL